jgi:nitrite reductase/ring-hydroxylating ferredoxin subunit
MATPVLPMAALDDGEMTVVKVDGVDVLVCHVDGVFHAVHALCSHARQSLATGKLRGHQIQCPLHGARFDVRTGQCLAAPAQRPIPSFPVTIESGKVCVEVTGVEEPPKPKFGPI